MSIGGPHEVLPPHGVTAEEAVGFLPPDPWLTALILRAEAFRQLVPVELRRLHWEGCTGKATWSSESRSRAGGFYAMQGWFGESETNGAG